MIKVVVSPAHSLLLCPSVVGLLVFLDEKSRSLSQECQLKTDKMITTRLLADPNTENEDLQYKEIR
jgi:hypothetical protein